MSKESIKFKGHIDLGGINKKDRFINSFEITGIDVDLETVSNPIEDWDNFAIWFESYLTNDPKENNFIGITFKDKEDFITALKEINKQALKKLDLNAHQKSKFLREILTNK